MEVSQLIFGQSRSFPGVVMDSHLAHYPGSSYSLSIPTRLSLKPARKMCGFDDESHLDYYNCKNKSSAILRCAKIDNIKVKETKKIKNKLKLLKGLSRDLSTFTELGFRLESDQDKGNTIKEVAELLMEQLQKTRAVEKEMKRKNKEEKAQLKAAQMQTRRKCESSSSSSSESSDSECGEVVDMSRLKRAQAIPDSMQTANDEVTSIPPSRTTEEENIIEAQVIVSDSVPATPSPPTPGIESVGSHNSGQDCCSGTGSFCGDASNVSSSDNNSLVNLAPARKIEVCMGGKCKKSGAAALLEEFQRVVGIEGEVSGCKCMGKCRDGPNVRILNSVEADGGDVSVRTPSNPLCIGVGLEDVGLIVANFLGKNQNAFVAAAAL